MRPGDRIADRFRIERFVARGGMGDVYCAIDEHDGRRVALKRIFIDEPSAVKRFNLEARALIEVAHPAVVRYVAHEADPARGSFLAMEWVEGHTLRDRLKTDPLTTEQSLDLAARIAEGLGAAHARGMVHRDIKPGNIMLENGAADRPKILDFGIVRLNEWQDITATGMGPGTPAYMAPEQARGWGGVGAATDVFALGCVLYKCLTGQTAYRGTIHQAVLAKIAVMAAPPRVHELQPRCPAPVDEMVAALMAHKPSGRPRDGAAAASRIRRVLEHLRPVTDPDETGPTARQLTTVEQRPYAVVFAQLAAPAVDTLKSADSDSALDAIGAATTIARSAKHVWDFHGKSDVPGLLPDVRRAMEPYGATVELLLTGSVVATLRGGVAATDLAARTARCSLALHAVLPDADIGVAVGRALAAEHPDVGDIIEASAALVKPGTCGVHINAVMSDLLPDRFELDGDRLVRERARQSPAEEPARKLLGRVTRCVGRSRVIRQLEAISLGIIEDRASQAVVLVGEPGIGKSRLRFELLQRLRESTPDLLVLPAWGDRQRTQVPYGLVGRMLRDHLGLPAPDAGSRIARSFDVMTASRDAERVIVFLTELMGLAVARASGPALRAARQDPELMAEHKRRAFEDWLAAECAAQPLMLIADDLHWADVTSVELLGGAIKRLRDAPFLVLAFARPGVRDRFPKLDDQWSRQEIRLHNLRPSDSEALIRDALGDELSDADAKALVDRSAGNPFYLEELIRAAAAGNRERLPDTVLASVQLRIGALPSVARQILRAASIFGRDFWVGGLHALLGSDTDEAELDRWLALLAQQEIVDKSVDTAFPGHPEWQFHHDLVRESAYEMLTDEDRVTGHRLAGQWLQDNGETEAIVLAEHFAGAGAASEAIDWYEKAAEQTLERTDARGSNPLDRAAMVKAGGYYRRAGEMATSTHANHQAIKFFERAVAMFGSGEPERTCRTLIALADVQSRVGERDDLRATLERADRLSAELEISRLRVEVLLRRAECERRGQDEGALAKALRLTRNARDLANTAGLVDLEAQAYSSAAGILQLDGGEESGATAIRYAEIVLRLVANTDAAAAGLWRMANAFLAHRNDTTRAGALYLQALDAAKRMGNDVLAADCLTNLAMVSFREWRLQEAVAQTEQALETYAEVGVRNRVRESRLNLGTFYHYLGSAKRARVLLTDCLDESEGDWILASACYESIALLERATGNERAAQAALRRAVDVVGKVGAEQRQALFLGRLAVSLWTTGDLAEAFACVEQAIEIGESVSLGHAQLMLRMGQIDSAAQWFEHFRRAEPDPDARMIAQLGLSRIHWWRGDEEAARVLCQETLGEIPRAVARHWLPASILLASVDGACRLAVDSLVRAQLLCAHDMVEEAMLDVATLFARAPLVSNDDRAAAAMFLDVSGDVDDLGLRFRIEHLRGRVSEKLGDVERSLVCGAASSAALRVLELGLPEPVKPTFAEHPWVRAVRDLRAV